MLRVLILGGYGTFGGRIVELLESEPRVALVVAGRSLDRAEAFCRARGDTPAGLYAARADRNSDLSTVLKVTKPDVVVDASGPFQAYGEGRYRVVQACIDHHVHYLDLADGSDFVAGIGAFDAAARGIGKAVLSGVSSFPVLTAAVVRRLTTDMSHVKSICGGIAPSPFAGVGLNVIRAIAGYAGQPVPLRRNGRNGIGYPFTDHCHMTIMPPGFVPLRSRLFSLVDVPDLLALATLWPQVDTIWMGAGPVPPVLHRLLAGLAWLVRLRLIPSLSPLAPLMHVATNRLRWGEDRGGMFVTVQGIDRAGQQRTRSWHLLAEGHDGPLIPSMAVEAIIRRILSGRAPEPGARAAVRDLELDDYEALFAGRRIATGVRHEAKPGQSLFRQLLGQTIDRLPAAIRVMHEGTRAASGRADIDRGTGILARLAAAITGFPKTGRDMPVDVRFVASDRGEIWVRTFAGRTFSSRQAAGSGPWKGLLCESFGPLRFGMALVIAPERLTLVLRRWSAFGIPMPMRLCLRSTSFETEQGGLFRFSIEITHPCCGLIVRYRGWLAPIVPV